MVENLQGLQYPIFIDMNKNFQKICASSLILFFILLFYSSPGLAKESIILFVGSASKPPVEEILRLWEKKTGIKGYATFGGSGYVLSQMILSKKGDIYFPGSSDYMEKAKIGGYIYPETERIVVYLVPAINVHKGNPHHIQELHDLLKPGLKIAIANPDGVCVGVYAIEIIEKSFSPYEKKAFMDNLINYTSSCARTASAISLNMVDAVIGWRVFQFWDPERIETIPLKKKQIVRIGYIPIAISRYTHNKKLAQRFIDFMLSPNAKKIFRKYHYFTTPDEAFKWIGEKKPVGGLYRVPPIWTRK